MTARMDEIRARALEDLRRFQVVMDGHFDFGNGFHGRVYLNPHQLLRSPSTIWRVAQNLLDIVPGHLLESTDLVAGPVTGGALLAHTMAGLLDGRRPLTRDPYSFAPFKVAADGKPALSAFYGSLMRDKRVLLADDVRNTGQTLARCAELVKAAGGEVVATVALVDRAAATVTLEVPNISLVEYKAAANYAAATCPLCASGVPVTEF